MIDPKKLNQIKNYFATQPVDVVYLCGSQAEGKATKFSDFDFGVLFKESLSSSKRYDLKLEMTTHLCGLLAVERVDVIDLKEAPLKFQYHAIFPKKVIFLENKDRMIELGKRAIKQYLDFPPSLFSIAARQLEITAEKGFSL